MQYRDIASRGWKNSVGVERQSQRRFGRRARLQTVSALAGIAVITCGPVRAEDWLQWGGPNGDFTVNTRGLAEKWPEGGPKQIWKRPLGDGYSSILCQAGKLFTMYRDGENEVVVSLDAKTGGTLWEFRYARALWPEMDPGFGKGPNATPVIAGDRIVSIGIDGKMHCLDVATGKLQWKHDLPEEFGRRKRVEEYGYSASPLPYKDTVIVQVGGDDHGVVALDPKDGAIVWKGDPGGVSYAQPTITRLAGRDQYVFFTPEGVAGLDPKTGKTLWQSEIPFNNGNHLTPIVKCDENHIWVSSQFLTGGARLLKITPSSDTMSAKEVWFKKKLRASHWTSIRIGDYIYGSIGDNPISFLAAFNWKTGKLAWRKRGFHKAQSVYADDKLMFIDENGKLGMARVTPEKLDVLDSAQVVEPISWTLPTLVDTTLYARDRKHILALDLSANAGN